MSFPSKPSDDPRAVIWKARLPYPRKLPGRSAALWCDFQYATKALYTKALTICGDDTAVHRMMQNGDDVGIGQTEATLLSQPEVRLVCALSAQGLGTDARDQREPDLASGQAGPMKLVAVLGAMAVALFIMLVLICADGGTS